MNVSVNVMKLFVSIKEICQQEEHVHAADILHICDVKYIRESYHGSGESKLVLLKDSVVIRRFRKKVEPLL